MSGTPRRLRQRLAGVAPADEGAPAAAGPESRRLRGPHVTEVARELVEKLRHHAEAYTRYKVLVHVVGQDTDSREARILREEVKETTLVRTLLAERGPDGQIPLHPYDKWRGAHWVLACLADLGYPPGEADLLPLRDQVCGWLFSPQHQQGFRSRVVEGRVRWHASMEGNALYALLALGLADQRVDELAARLLAWQWPDGGWNCDLRPQANHSSFTESLLPLRGLIYHHRHTGSPASRAAAERAAEVFLERRLFRRRSDGQVIRPDFALLHYPCYWHYDVLFGLKVMAELGAIGDPRCQEALDLLQSKQLPDAGFPAEGKHYQVGRGPASGASLVDWGGVSRRKHNEFVTADAFGVLTAAGRMRASLR
ncbi:MAG: hypothetical protein AB1505_15550 [Candidatus Latescibacterota bacterium]